MKDNQMRAAIDPAMLRPADGHAASPQPSPMQVWLQLKQVAQTPGATPMAKAATERAWMAILKAVKTA